MIFKYLFQNQIVNFNKKLFFEWIMVLGKKSPRFIYGLNSPIISEEF